MELASATMEIEGNNPFGGRSYLLPPPSSSSSSSSSSSYKPTSHSFLSTSLFDIGILKDTLLPSLALHSTLATAAFAIGSLTNRLETKDWLWPAGQVINAWWSAIGRRLVHDGASLKSALAALSRPERLILAGVTLWGGRLFARVARRTITRGTTAATGGAKNEGMGDDPRYEVTKREPGFWRKALWTVYLPQALFQTVVTLPFTAPFHHQGGSVKGYSRMGQALAVGVFCMGFGLESLADWQLDGFKERGKGEGGVERGMCREGVWGVVRHPNYLGDALLHLSFPLMLYASDMLAPIELLGPIANYLFLRFVGGDKENEYNQARRYSAENVTKKVDFDRYRREENSFWPDFNHLSSKWTWMVLGCGAAGATAERVLSEIFA
ncbi:hypothetical protein B0T17DRAFT_618270 [Bombardia bombarda]|uniref:Steroid 5-alpha reductase C-terminal domain-containing protein n=1 Tax=Bombardia bombarda TaxID=252184 RepID=A0AA39WUJ5_9PEZI|nr:hypothetical protein B0T17DRAFT_618270 [Bombardia bombarda]